MIVIYSLENEIFLNDLIGQRSETELDRLFKTKSSKEIVEMPEDGHRDPALAQVLNMSTVNTCKIKPVKINGLPLIVLAVGADTASGITRYNGMNAERIIKPCNVEFARAGDLESPIRPTDKFAEQHLTTADSLITAITTRDKRFLDTVVGIIENRITDPQFSVEELSRELAMSRSSLHKKLKVLTGHVPNGFIRIIRLKKALQLLLSKEYNISEISYLAGFNSHSYFSKCFLSHFKMSPVQFLHRKNGKNC